MTFKDVSLTESKPSLLNPDKTKLKQTLVSCVFLDHVILKRLWDNLHYMFKFIKALKIFKSIKCYKMIIQSKVKTNKKYKIDRT